MVGGRSYLFQPPRKAVGLSGINPSFLGLSRYQGWITHVLLTRSPLSPVPKDWFSLDLHVLSAPPAFVLSQDQTLREDWFAGICSNCISGNLLFELVLKVSPRTKHEVTGSFRPEQVPFGSPTRTWGCLEGPAQDLDVFTLLSFQRPVLLESDAKKAPVSRRGFESRSECRIRLRPKASKLSRLQGL